MTITITQAHNNARLAGTLAYLDTGASTARLRIYGGTRPASPTTAPGSAMLVEIPLTKPAGTVAGGVLSLTQSANGMVEQSGVATWARAVNGNGDPVFDADAGQGPGAWEVVLAQAQLYAGGEVALTSATLG